ncbi:uncharacterized protein V1510DRAFT_244261 [Dipodascopsis tothii]|uniref:uncharacterized protein n=1 Tax=Dipodascopsis tothii TaxID=44089 RepID=UPI0034CDB17A
MDSVRSPDAAVDGTANGEAMVGVEMSSPAADGVEVKRDYTEELSAIDKELEQEVLVPPQTVPLETSLPYTSHKTGLCYDMRMRYHAKLSASVYDYTDPHPEDPRRIYRVYKALAEAGLVDYNGSSATGKIGDVMQYIPAREATKDEVTLVHNAAHWDFLERTTAMTQDELMEETENGDSVYFNKESFFSAKLACGGVIDTTKAIVNGAVRNAFAVVRPPGHHAEPDKPAGFCMFGNVAVACKVLLEAYPDKVKKIMILDWDVHHGNGTQRAFYDDPRVLYVSLHRYENAKFYPGSSFGNYDKCGEGPGKGFSVNIPWRNGGMQDGDYLYAFQRVVMPIGQEYGPDLVIISAGFDAAAGDQIGGCFVTPAAYGHMTHQLKSLANGRLAVALEGGYNLDSTANSALAVTKVLLGEAPPTLSSVYAQPDAVEVVDRVVRTQAKYWQCMRIGTAVKDPDGGVAVERLHDILRGYQSVQLFEKYQMTMLPIFRERISASFRDQVLCMPNFHTAETIILYVHDPPDVSADINPTTGQLNLHECLLRDSSGRYIDWAAEKKFSFIDVNVPGFLTGVDDDQYNAQNAVQDLCLYIWDNYLELTDVRNIIFIGAGDACAGLVYLMGHREVKERVKASISFVGGTSIRAIVPLVDEYIVDWYYKNSLVYANASHPIWDPSNNGGKKPRKKFGNVIKTETESIARAMADMYEEAVEFAEIDIESADDDASPSSQKSA